jgi:nucleoside 2-deoxyribosyltransferase
MKAYLAHPTSSRKVIREWELQIEQLYSIALVNPFYDIEGVEKGFVLRADKGEDFYKMDKPYNFNSSLVWRDLQTILECDCTIAVIDGNISYGTIMEICYSKMFNKPVYIICSTGHEKHPWLVHHATKIFKSTLEFDLFLREHKDTQYMGLKYPILF